MKRKHEIWNEYSIKRYISSINSQEKKQMMKNKSKSSNNKYKNNVIKVFKTKQQSKNWNKFSTKK
jgi:hypothetical protein